MSWNVVKITISFIVGFIVAVYACSVNDVEYANYCTLEYKEAYISAADSLIDELMDQPKTREYIENNVPDTYIKYCYYAYYLPDNAEAVTYEKYKEDFDL